MSEEINVFYSKTDFTFYFARDLKLGSNQWDRFIDRGSG